MRNIFWWFKKLSNKGLIAFCFLLFVLLIALFAPIIAGRENGFSLIKYKPYTPDYANSNYISPLQEQLEFKGENKVMLEWSKWHWLGTNKLGEDVLSGIVHGAKVSMLVGFLSMFLAVSIGLVIGLFAGYYGNETLKLRTGEIVCLILSLIPAFFYASVIPYLFLNTSAKSSILFFSFQIVLSVFAFLFLTFLFFKIGKFISYFKLFSKKHFIPIDSLLMRATEVVISLPALIIIFSFAAVMKPSVFNLIVIIGFISWTEVARIVRAETLKIKSSGFADAARALGYNDARIIFKHLLPNILPMVSSIALLIFASAILSEASLSFLGIGIPYQTVTWGTLLASAREQISAWWLIVFPGFMLAATLMSLYQLREELSAQ